MALCVRTGRSGIEGAIGFHVFVRERLVIHLSFSCTVAIPPPLFS